jgi:hypothetical protein
MKKKQKPHTVVYLTEFNTIKNRYEVSLKPLDRIPEIAIIEDAEAKALDTVLNSGSLVVLFVGERMKNRIKGKPLSFVVKRMVVDHRVVHRVSIFGSFEILLTSDDSSTRRLMSILYPIITRLKDDNNFDKSPCNV